MRTFDPFELIGHWYGQYADTDWSWTREELRQWMVRPSLNGNTLSLQEVCSINDLDLAIDCLIRSNIGEDGIQLHYSDEQFWSLMR